MHEYEFGLSFTPFTNLNPGTKTYEESSLGYDSKISMLQFRNGRYSWEDQKLTEQKMQFTYQGPQIKYPF